MKKTITIFTLLLVMSFQGNTQIITQNQGIEFAKKLEEVKMLSEKGKQHLIQKIQSNDFGYEYPQSKLSVSNLLMFLSQTFENDFYYRSGMFEIMKIEQELIEKGAIKEQENFQLDSNLVQKRIEISEGYQIEEAIEAEDEFPDTGFTRFAFMRPRYNEVGFIHKERSVLGKTRTRTANDLLKIGLIDNQIHSEILEGIQSKKLSMELYVLIFAMERAIFYENFEGNKTKEQKFIQKLHAAKIINNENLSKLLAYSEKKELKEKYDLIPYCNNAKVFLLKNYAVDPTIGYQQIFEEIKEIVPNFNFKNFKAEIIKVKKEWEDELKDLNVVIEFEVDQVKYRNTFFYDFITKGKNRREKNSLLKISTNFHQGINKLLADKNSLYRLYYANQSKNGNAYGDEEFGLILLTKEEFEIFNTPPTSYFLFKQSHDNTFNSKHIEKTIEEYIEIGLFEHLTKEEIEKGKNCVRESKIDSYQSILRCFPKIVFYLSGETGNFENPYEEQIKAFSAASRGTFTPKNIVDNFEKDWKTETTIFSFEFNGKKYEETLRIESDWLDYSFVELIEKALTDHNIDGQIYACSIESESLASIFLTKKQFQFLNKNQKSLFSEY